MYEEDSSIFKLPNEANAPAVAVAAQAPEPAKVETTVAEAAKVVPTEQPARLVDSFSNSDKLSDQALFDELNAVSEEVIKCRDHILNQVS